MRIELLWIGKTREKEISALMSYYIKRLPAHWNFSITEIPDLKNAKNKSAEQIKQEESALVLSKLSPKASLILLDENGKEYSSEAFAHFIEKKALAGTQELVFVIGGAYGHHESLRSKAAGAVSLSKMTFTHQMARLFFIEQLYRADQILQGKPYHNP